jgi:hypothetical protein
MDARPDAQIVRGQEGWTWNAGRALLALSISAATVPAFAVETVVVKWNEAALEAIRITHPGPPIVARALAVVHTCMYDAWAAYDAKADGTRLGGSLRRPVAERTEANKQEAVSFAAYRALVDLFPTEALAFDVVMDNLGYNPDDAGTAGPTTPAGVGTQACNAVLEFRHADGANQLNGYADTSGYVPVNTPEVVNDVGRWQPLEVNGVEQKFITPHWGGVKGFALTKYDQFKLPEPVLPGTDAFEEQAREVIAYSAMLNDTQKVIAEYWADGPSSELPPGHWTLFAQAVSERDEHGLDEDVKMFFAMTNATFDASVATWGYKREFDYVRPVTAIRELFRGEQLYAWAGPYNGTQLIPAENWNPYQAATVVTPPFAEYVSGHSAFSAAAAEVLRRYTGSDVFMHSATIPAGASPVEPGTTPADDVTLTWATFTDASDEAAISRRYGGIHFKDGDLNGRTLGRKVGENAWEKAMAYFNGGKGHGHGKEDRGLRRNHR